MLELIKLPKEYTTIALENCVFCRKATAYWYEPKDVACCRRCGAEAEPNDVPTKKQWWRREMIAAGRRG